MSFPLNCSLFGLILFYPRLSLLFPFPFPFFSFIRQRCFFLFLFLFNGGSSFDFTFCSSECEWKRANIFSSSVNENLRAFSLRLFHSQKEFFILFCYVSQRAEVNIFLSFQSRFCHHQKQQFYICLCLDFSFVRSQHFFPFMLLASLFFYPQHPEVAISSLVSVQSLVSSDCVNDPTDSQIASWGVENKEKKEITTKYEREPKREQGKERGDKRKKRENEDK